MKICAVPEVSPPLPRAFHRAKKGIAEIGRRVLARAVLFKARRHSVATLVRLRPSRILVVCHGNIYRSAFAAEWLKTRVPGSVFIRSAGFYPLPGRPAPARHVEMARQRGVDLSGHASHVIRPDDLRWADIIVLMDRRNWIELRSIGVDSGKLVWLGAFAAGDVEIADPYNMNDVAASALLDRLVECADRLLQLMERGGSVKPASRIEQPPA